MKKNWSFNNTSQSSAKKPTKRINFRYADKEQKGTFHFASQKKKNCCNPLLVSGRGCYYSIVKVVPRHNLPVKSSNSTSELCNFCAKIYFRKFQKENGFHWLRINKRATYRIWLLSVSVPAVFLFDINKNSNVTNDKNVLKSNEPTYQISLLKRYGREIINRVI